MSYINAPGPCVSQHKGLLVPAGSSIQQPSSQSSSQLRETEAWQKEGKTLCEHPWSAAINNYWGCSITAWETPGSFGGHWRKKKQHPDLDERELSPVTGQEERLGPAARSPVSCPWHPCTAGAAWAGGRKHLCTSMCSQRSSVCSRHPGVVIAVNFSPVPSTISMRRSRAWENPCPAHVPALSRSLLDTRSRV